ncbi:hypothetical protein IT6_01220 [Methylacidiphilum caldifontis]|uniref:hypothetical protein n=1 Tax=Methylacidiphilum caldifontis TaxID=2795386 RepID=UPI001A8D50AC|nr:hypothetical protein [Methylacidiphilum caldifontis]QSR88955.1 hypothetical protein IT6_01220 [Methylacidiphilum caldifontis]
MSNKKDQPLDTKPVPTSVAQETLVLGREPSLLLPWENSKVDLDSSEVWSDKIAASDAPAGLMGTAHMHRKYQPMIGFWWMYMNMGPDYFQGSSAMNLTGLEAIRYAGKPIAMGNVTMFMEQYMPMLMMGLTDNLTFMAMFPIWNKQMDMVGLPMGGYMTHGMGGGMGMGVEWVGWEVYLCNPCHRGAGCLCRLWAWEMLIFSGSTSF